MFLISEAHAQGAAPAAAGGFDGTLMIVMVGVLAVMFISQFRAQGKRRKETQAMLDAIVKGDEVVTTGGVVGKVSKLGDNYLHIESGSGELQVQRSAIVQVLPKGTLK